MNTVFNESLAILQQISFLRADWFYAFIPLLIYLFFYINKTNNSKNWQNIIDPQLQTFVLEKNNHKQSHYPVILISIAVSLCITALAGPVYKKLPQPVYREQSSLVVLLDLSQSMNSADIKPSRLARAKLELLDILKTRKTGQTALIVYAADAFAVTPLTDDNATIANLIPSLETNMMPAQGSDLSKAIAKAFSLFTQAGVISGDILLITDDIHKTDEAAIKKLFSQGHRLSILGVGTTVGGPIPLDGGFLLDKQGAIVVPKLYPAKLQQYALTGGGLYTGLSAGDSDTLKLTRLFESSEVAKETSNNNLNADIWQEEGYWLLFPLLFFAALWARKGWIALVILFILPLPQPGYADTNNNAKQNTIIDTNNLWSSQDQKAMRAFKKGDTAEAAKQFKNEAWKASALYKNGDYEAAIDTLKNTSTSDGFYNKGNALAKLGNYAEAIKAYDKAIETNANNADAKYNREQVKQALKAQQETSKNSENKQPSDQDTSEQNDKDEQNSAEQDSKSKESQNQESESKNSENQNSQSQESEKKESKEQNSEQKPVDENQTSEPNDKQSDAENQQNEEELKQRDAQQEAKEQQEEQRKYEQNQKHSAEKNQVEDDAESEEAPKEIEINPKEASISEAEKATEQWLKRIPDDPGGLLKRKFLYQYNQLPNQTDDKEPW